MAEWSNAHDSKSCYVGTRTEVRILFSAPNHAVPNWYGVIFFGKRTEEFEGRQANKKFAQVCGYCRRQNRIHPLFSVRAAQGA